MRRYRWLGRWYDVVSLEGLLYRRLRARLPELLDPEPGTVVVDVGCGTGLNFNALHNAVGPAGTVVGIEPSASMRAAAQRRVRRHGWSNVTVLDGTVATLSGALDQAGVVTDDIDAVVATFVLSLVADDAPFWAFTDALGGNQPIRVAIADLGRPADAPWPVRPLLSVLAALGGGDVDRRPWTGITARDPDTRHETFFGGHVHVAVGTVGIHPPRASVS